MLVLSRHRDESILIGDSITITVLSIQGDKVRLGITAPKDIRIDRDEVRARYDYDARNGTSSNEGNNQ